MYSDFCMDIYSMATFSSSIVHVITSRNSQCIMFLWRVASLVASWFCLHRQTDSIQVVLNERHLLSSSEVTLACHRDEMMFVVK